MEHGDLLAKLLSLAAFILTLILTFAGTQYGGILDDLYLILVGHPFWLCHHFMPVIETQED